MKKPGRVSKTENEEKWYILHNAHLCKELKRVEGECRRLERALNLKEATVTFLQRQINILDGALQLLEEQELDPMAVKVFAAESLNAYRKANIDGDLRKAWKYVNELKRE